MTFSSEIKTGISLSEIKTFISLWYHHDTNVMTIIELPTMKSTLVFKRFITAN